MLHSYIQTTLGISEGLDSLNLDVYLTYKISVTNESDKYKVEVNQISDYVDSSLELVTTDEKKYIDNIDGTPAGAVVVAKGPDWTWTKEGTYTDKTTRKNVERDEDGTIIKDGKSDYVTSSWGYTKDGNLEIAVTELATISYIGGFDFSCTADNANDPKKFTGVYNHWSCNDVVGYVGRGGNSVVLS